MEKQNKSFTLLIVGLIAALFLLVAQSYMLTNQNNNQDTISVSGKSEMNVAPDKAEVYISITTENDDSSIAQKDNKELSNKVIAALKDAGVADKDIQTTNFRINENYRYSIYSVDELNKVEEVNKVQELKYEAVHSIKISTTDLDKVGSLVDIAVNAGANGVDNIKYTLTDEKEKEVRAEALNKAIEAGKEKANSMTQTLGIKLGDVVSVNENNYYYTPYTFEANIKTTAMDAGGSGDRLNYLSPEDVSISATVSLEYEIQ